MAVSQTGLVQSQFGRAAADYATSDVHAKGESLARIVELAEPQAFWLALDVATGAGHMAAAFAPYVRSVVASDVTVEMLDQAAKLAAERGLANLTTTKADAGQLPFADASFDLVCCRLAAHHFPSLAQFVDETRRVLKPGGRFALVDNVAPDANESDSVVLAYNAFEKLRDPSHAFAPPPSTWVNLLSTRGFKIIAREQMSKEMAFDAWVQRMRCTQPVVAELRAALDDVSLPLATFLKQRRDADGALHFSLQELLVVAEKST